MTSTKLLRKQVDSELKKRRYVIYTILLLSVIYISTTLLLGERGVVRYTELKDKELALSAEVAKIRNNNERLQGVIEEYSENDYYIEKNAREKFGLAEPDEFLYLYEK